MDSGVTDSKRDGNESQFNTVRYRGFVGEILDDQSNWDAQQFR